MPATLEAYRDELRERVDGLLDLVVADADARIVSLDRALGWGYRRAGLVPADGFIPSDEEVGNLTVGGRASETTLDLAEYRILANVRNRWTEVTTRVGMGEVRLSDLRDSLDRRLMALERQYNLNMQPLVGGRIALASHDPDAETSE